jgi:hypothetical protein
MNFYESCKKADEWITSNCWLAVFDILGFSNLITVNEDNLQAFSARVDYEETIQHLKSCHDKAYLRDSLDYCWFSDTFLILTVDDSAQSYVAIQSISKCFIDECIHSRSPIRGAIAVGLFVRRRDNRSFMGSAFIEAFKYAEAQDWIGLLITPDAVKKAKSYGLDPTHHDFVKSDDIPMHKFAGQNILAYRFQNGAANFPSHLLQPLSDMKTNSEIKYRSKYERTEKFIGKYYQWIANRFTQPPPTDNSDNL